MTRFFKNVVNYEIFGLEESFQWTCFEHVFSKACQYIMIDDKTCKGLKHVFIKFTHANLQKHTTWPKTFSKGKHEWKNACEDFWHPS
jgi:hypothetical protein